MDGAALIVKEKDLNAVALAVSFTVIPIDVATALVGVPEMTPVPDASDNPAGIVPDVTVHETYGVVPPLAARVTV
jgi:hypothetical protein